MIAHVYGVLVEKFGPSSAIVDVNGVGYEVQLAASDFEDVSINSNVKFYTYHHIREQSQELFGFSSLVAKKLFEMLPEGTTEIMCHPGAKEAQPSGAASSAWLDRGRVKEYLALVDPKTKEALLKCGASLINFGDL